MFYLVITVRFGPRGNKYHWVNLSQIFGDHFYYITSTVVIMIVISRYIFNYWVNNQQINTDWSCKYTNFSNN